MGNGKVKVVAAAKFGGLGCVCSEHHCWREDSLPKG